MRYSFSGWLGKDWAVYRYEFLSRDRSRQTTTDPRNNVFQKHKRLSWKL
ncbi:MAG: hypothetical protein UV04_C0003G0081 [Candidatus Gottesmanbacteria bacterium GW2011_GWA2_42_16]|nr:MAG: hypothetical protein UV04_C0003G0081 [Candidatus Gottesmanbacteria bacterium GW2011_GWA2_42_16]